MLVDALASWCPAWEASKDSEDFPSKELTKYMLSNKQYAKLTPVANTVDLILKSAGSILHRGGPPIFAPELLKAAGLTRNLAFDVRVVPDLRGLA